MLDLDNIVDEMLEDKPEPKIPPPLELGKKAEKEMAKAVKDSITSGIGVVNLSCDDKFAVKVEHVSPQDLFKEFDDKSPKRENPPLKEAQFDDNRRPDLMLPQPTVVDMDTGKITPPKAVNTSYKGDDSEPHDPLAIHKRNVFDVEIAKSKLDANSISELVVRSKDFIVETEVQAEQGLDMAMEARKISKALETSRKEIIRPHLDFNIAVNKMAKDLSGCLNAITNALTKKVDRFEYGQKESFEKAGVEIAPKLVESKECSHYFRDVISISVVDLKLVPREYLVFDKSKATRAVTLGLRKIPGLKIKVEKVKTYRTKS